MPIKNGHVKTGVDRRLKPVQLSSNYVDRRYRLGKYPFTMAMILHPALTNQRLILAAGLLLPLAFAGCTPIVANRGNMLDEDRIAQVKVGDSSKNDVFEALGSPSIVSTFDDNTWYYVGQRTERESFFPPEVTDRKLIAVQFDDSDHVRSIDRVGLEQAVEVEPMEQTTPAVGREITFMEQLLGNIGRPSSKKKKKSSDDQG